MVSRNNFNSSYSTNCVVMGNTSLPLGFDSLIPCAMAVNGYGMKLQAYLRMLAYSLIKDSFMVYDLPIAIFEVPRGYGSSSIGFRNRMVVHVDTSYDTVYKIVNSNYDCDDNFLPFVLIVNYNIIYNNDICNRKRI